MRVSVVIDADGVEVDLTAHEDLPAIRRREIEIYVANTVQGLVVLYDKPYQGEGVAHG